ncbi:glypican-1-like [Chiloscyllium plagiosum]|uniref:glypican-1-like n=1 Tax=Chiloscyllium plagiosum TaxID=36176 RepID=UPI001CB80ECF|nr:glypican-1-like [Chiloscyllium plagiosum]
MMWISLCLAFLGLFPSTVLGDQRLKTCSDMRMLYSSKGFSVAGAPSAEISGEHLRICPQGYTCCTSEMEDNLAKRSLSEFEAMVRNASNAVQMMLTTQHNSFDSYFQELLDQSEKNLHRKLTHMYGLLCAENSKIFKDLFSELRHYYKGANINLEEVLNEFWSRLMECQFKHQNPHYQISDEYLECMVKHAEPLRPFGEVPRFFKMRLTRVFIAARSFVRSLSLGTDVVKKVSQVPPSPECARAMMRLMYCPHCRSMASVKPCNNYCLNILKGCLANHADLDSEWRNLVDSMVQVADRFNGPSNMESLVDTIYMKIAEAIQTMRDNRAHISSKVLQGCGHLKSVSKRSTEDDPRRRGKPYPVEERPVSLATPPMDRLVTEVKMKLRDVRQLWVTLPSALCSEKVTAGLANEDRCWNGQNRGRYLPEVMADGLANQINNPEVEVDITKPDMTIRQQIMQLRIMTNRLRNAYNGNDVDFQDTSDDSSGSGSGDACLEDGCSRRRFFNAATRSPVVYAIPEQSGKSNPGNGGNVLQCSAASFHLLALALALPFFCR